MNSMSRRKAFLVITGIVGCTSSFLRPTRRARAFDVEETETSSSRKNRLSSTDLSTSTSNRDSITGIGIRDPHYASGSEAAYIIDGAIVCFDKSTSAEQRCDVSNTILLAQRAATKKASRTAKPSEWLQTFREVLDTVGWAVQQFTFQTFNSSKPTFVIGADVLLPMLPLIGKSVATNALQSISSVSKDDERRVLYESASCDVQDGIGIFAVVSYSAGALVMSLAIAQVHTEQKIEGSLAFPLDAKRTECKSSSQSMSLDMAVFGKLRDQIAKKLADLPKTGVKNIDLQYKS